jgi:hypothetical protein
MTQPRDELDIQLPPDEPPTGGVWAESPFKSITDEEVAQGNFLGTHIDTDNDEDNGL